MARMTLCGIVLVLHKIASKNINTYKVHCLLFSLQNDPYWREKRKKIKMCPILPPRSYSAKSNLVWLLIIFHGCHSHRDLILSPILATELQSEQIMSSLYTLAFVYVIYYKKLISEEEITYAKYLNVMCSKFSTKINMIKI